MGRLAGLYVWDSRVERSRHAPSGEAFCRELVKALEKMS